MRSRILDGVAFVVIWAMAIAAAIAVGEVYVSTVLDAWRGDKAALFCCLGWVGIAVLFWAIGRRVRLK